MGLYLIERFTKVSIAIKLAFIFLMVALWTGWTAFCSHSWVVTYIMRNNVYFSIAIGPWRYSSDMPDAANIFALDPNQWTTTGVLIRRVQATQFCITLSFICMNVGFLLLILLMFVEYCRTNNRVTLLIWNGFINIVACISWIVGIVVFVLDSRLDTAIFREPTRESRLGHAVYLAGVTSGLQLLTGICLLVAICVGVNS